VVGDEPLVCGQLRPPDRSRHHRELPVIADRHRKREILGRQRLIRGDARMPVAPRSARNMDVNGPARTRLKSATSTPLNGPGVV